MKDYVLRKIDEEQAGGDALWNRIDKAHIDVYPWDVNGYRPVAYARAFYTDSRIHVQLTAEEDTVMATHVARDRSVCNDSCLEFFFNPDPEHGSAYLNFEFNPIGTFLLESGLAGQRTFLKAVPDALFAIRHSHDRAGISQKTNGSWRIAFSIPHDLIKTYYPHYQAFSGAKITGNFYKCGDSAAFPHYGCWNLVGTETPNFHKPEYFGALIFE